MPSIYLTIAYLFLFMRWNNVVLKKWYPHFQTCKSISSQTYLLVHKISILHLMYYVCPRTINWWCLSVMQKSLLTYLLNDSKLTKLNPRLPTIMKCAVVSCSSSPWAVTSSGTCSVLCATITPWTHSVVYCYQFYYLPSIPLHLTHSTANK